MPKLWSRIHFYGKQSQREGNFSEFPMENKCLLLYPPWPCLLHTELEVWFWGKEILCKSSTSSFPEMSLRKWHGEILVFVLRITADSPVLLQANTGFWRGFSTFAVWDLFAELERDVSGPSASLTCIWKIFSSLSHWAKICVAAIKWGAASCFNQNAPLISNSAIPALGQAAGSVCASKCVLLGTSCVLWVQRELGGASLKRWMGLSWLSWFVLVFFFS